MLVMNASNRRLLSAQTADFSQWWSVFSDPVLDKLVQSAYMENLTLRIAGVRVLEARAVLGIAVGRQYPQQQVGVADYSYNNLSSHNPGTAFGDITYSALSIGEGNDSFAA